jgi:hypothetical protein
MYLPAYGISAGAFWKKCQAMVRTGLGCGTGLSENAPRLSRDGPPTIADLERLGAGLTFTRDYRRSSTNWMGCSLMRTGCWGSGWTLHHQQRHQISSMAAVCGPMSRSSAAIATDEEGRITFPGGYFAHSAQYLFRITKGLLNLSQDVNDHMRPTSVPSVPNMVYLGDGPTDVPVSPSCGSMAANIAVYNTDDQSLSSFRKCYQLVTHANKSETHCAERLYARQYLRLIGGNDRSGGPVHGPGRGNRRGPWHQVMCDKSRAGCAESECIRDSELQAMSTAHGDRPYGITPHRPQTLLCQGST